MKHTLTVVIACGLICAWSASVSAQNGVPDTITLKPAALSIGESRSIELWLYNDQEVPAIQFTFRFAPLDSGFAKIDSIVGVGRLADPSVLPWRLLSPSQRDGVSPDTVTIAVQRQDGNYLPVGSGPILLLYVTGVDLGTMRIDTARNRLGNGTAVLNLQSAKVPFLFESVNYDISAAEEPPVLTAPLGIVKGIVGEQLTFEVSAVSPHGSPVTLSLESIHGFDDTAKQAGGSPIFDGLNPGVFSWTPSSTDAGIWVASFTATDSAGKASQRNVRMQIVSTTDNQLSFSEVVSDGILGGKTMAHGDFDGDNYQEVVLGGIPNPSADHTMSCYSTSGGGQFETVWSASDKFARHSIVAGYFRTTGNLDIATCKSSPVELMLYGGNGDNTFTRYDAVSPSDRFNSGCVFDFNHDGASDLAGVRANHVYVFAGALNSDFVKVVDAPSADTALSANAADFNHDGWDDLAVGTVRGLDIYLNNQSGGIVKAYHYDQEFGVADIEVTNQGSDFNNDGRYDLCLATPSIGGATSQLKVYLGRPNGTFDQQLVCTVNGQIFADCAGDFNGDHELDIAYINGATRTMSILLGNGNGQFSDENRFDLPKDAPFLMDCFDVDLDGDLDVIVHSHSPSVRGQLVAYLNQLDAVATTAGQLSFQSTGNATLEVASPSGGKASRIMSSISSASLYLKPNDAGTQLNTLTRISAIESGAYTLRLLPRPDRPAGTPFGLSYKIGSVNYRVVVSAPMPASGLTFDIYPDGSSPISPSLGEFIHTAQPAFVWPGTGEFEFELASDAEFVDLLEQSKTAGPSHASNIVLEYAHPSPYFWRVRPVGSTAWNGFYSFNVELVPTDVDDPQGELPMDFSLNQNYPNPFNPSTLIRFSIPKAAEVKIEVFNVLGQSIALLCDQKFTAGEHEIEWNGQDRQSRPVTSGVYFYKLTTEGFVQARKMLLLK